MEQNAAVGVHILHIELILHARVRLPLHVVGLDTVCNGQHVLPRGIGGNRSARAVLIFRNLINDIAVTARQHRSHLGARHTVRRTCCGKTAVAVNDDASHVVTVAVIYLHRVVRHHKVRNFSVGRRNERSARGYRELDAVKHIANAARDKALHTCRNSVHRDFAAYHMLFAGRREHRRVRNRNSRHIRYAAVQRFCNRHELQHGSVLLLDDTDGRIVLDKAVYIVRSVLRNFNRVA